MITWRSEGGAVPHERPRFELSNGGGTAVRILGVRSGCGCTVAHASPEWVPPRGRAYVDLEVTPLDVGDRSVTVVVETDSPTRPEVPLQVLIEGRRRPPYVLGIKGDLYFRAGSGPDEVRRIEVETIQVRGEPAQVPEVSSDLPFLHVDRPVVVERPHAFDARLIGRDYTYAVRFAADPPTEGFDGQVWAHDPWEAGRTVALAVHGEDSPPIRVAPSRLVLTVDGLESGRVVPVPRAGAGSWADRPRRDGDGGGQPAERHADPA